MARVGKHGVSPATPQNILFGAGTIHKNLVYSGTDVYSLTADTKFVAGKTYYTRSGSSPDYVYTATTQNVGASVTANTYYEKTIESGSWNFDASIIGATSGGSKFTIQPEISNVEIDGALVKAKGLSDVKTGETASLEINFAELNSELIKMAVIGSDGVSEDSSYDLIESKSQIAAGDYLNNIAFVGSTLSGTKIIVILDNALCTSGLELEGKNKEAGVVTMTFECYAPLSGDLDTLPYHIYYPSTSA